MQAQVLRIADEGRRKPLKVDFSKRLLTSIRPPASGRTWLYDTATPGLGLQITANGARTYYLYRWVRNRPQRVRLAAFEEVTVDQARRLAAKVSLDVANGADPMAQKQAARAESTFAEIFHWFIDTHAKPHKRTWKEDQAKYDLHLSSWGNRRLTEITIADVQRLHLKISKTAPGAANRVLSLISVIFRKARLLGYTGPNPASGVTRNKEVDRERFLLPEELPRFMAALETDPDADFRDLVKVLLFTGARCANGREMKWAELNLKAGTWTIPAEKFKTGRPLLLPLSPAALEVLKARAATAKKGVEYVFPVKGHPDQPMPYPQHLWPALVKRAGIPDLHLHDLRRSYGSYMAMAGANLPAIGRALGHRAVQTTKIYARLGLSAVKDAIDRGAAAMQAALNNGQQTQDK